MLLDVTRSHLAVLQKSGQVLKAVTVQEDRLQNRAVLALEHVLDGFYENR